jgi:hypothetical protein
MYALENGVWTQKQKLLSPSGVPGPGTDGNFGNSMQLDNDFLYIGERTLNKVHIYQYDLESATLIETLEGPSSSRFGDALHLRNDELMIGARGEDIFKGAVYRYQTPVDSIVLFAPCQSLPDSLFSVQIDSCSTKYMVVDGEEEWTFHFATLGQEVIDALDLDTFYCSITEVPSLGYEVNLTDSIIPMFSVEWTAEVIEDGMVYNASQLLDDPFSLNPTYEADVTGEIERYGWECLRHDI